MKVGKAPTEPRTQAAGALYYSSRTRGRKSTYRHTIHMCTRLQQHSINECVKP